MVVVLTLRVGSCDYKVLIAAATSQTDALNNSEHFRCVTITSPHSLPTTAISMSVSLSVCLLAYLKNHPAELHQIIVYVTYGRGSILLWQRRHIRYVLPVLWMMSRFHIMVLLRHVYSYAAIEHDKHNSRN